MRYMRDIHCRGKSVYTGEWITGYYIGTGTLCKYGDEHWSVDDETVGQTTGLPDKNGKIIYEGDIVKRHATPMFVKWDKESASFIVAYYSHNKYYENTLDGHMNLEIIGNIHDNPELIG